MGTNEYSQPASKSSWDSQDFGDVNMVVKMAHFYKSSRPQWVKGKYCTCLDIWQLAMILSLRLYVYLMCIQIWKCFIMISID